MAVATRTLMSLFRCACTCSKGSPSESSRPATRIDSAGVASPAVAGIPEASARCPRPGACRRAVRIHGPCRPGGGSGNLTMPPFSYRYVRQTPWRLSGRRGTGSRCTEMWSPDSSRHGVVGRSAREKGERPTVGCCRVGARQRWCVRTGVPDRGGSAALQRLDVVAARGCRGFSRRAGGPAGTGPVAGAVVGGPAQAPTPSAGPRPGRVPDPARRPGSAGSKGQLRQPRSAGPHRAAPGLQQPGRPGARRGRRRRHGGIPSPG